MNARIRKKIQKRFGARHYAHKRARMCWSWWNITWPVIGSVLGARAKERTLSCMRHGDVLHNDQLLYWKTDCLVAHRAMVRLAERRLNR